MRTNKPLYIMHGLVYELIGRYFKYCKIVADIKDLDIYDQNLDRNIHLRLYSL